jgi:regulator of replication initiation timing
VELKEMTEIRESPQGDSEKTIERLKNDIADLRKRVKELQKENVSLRDKLSHSEELATVPIEEKKSLKLFKKQKKKQLSEKSVVSKEMDLDMSSAFESPSVPLSTTHKSIMEGDSRRMCPSCDNNRRQFIYEETDKTHILMDYPRIYGKKFKCGSCGQEWRLPVSLE